MSNNQTMANKRAILLSAKLRFSSETQPIKDIAVGKAVEQTLLLADDNEGLDLATIQKQGTITLAGDIPVINRADIQRLLERLAYEGRVTEFESSGTKKYRLSEAALQELQESQEATEKRFRIVVEELFSNAGRSPAGYIEPFLDFLCRVFSKLGDNYVRLMKDEINSEQFLSTPNLNRLISKIKKRYRFIDEGDFKPAVVRFFENDDPDYAAVKWNMAQNFYVAKALGLDSSGHLLSKEVFGNAILYLDTNVLISALEPKAQHHASFKALSEACKQLQIELKTCQISVNELKNAVEYQYELISKVANQIPSGTASKVGNLFYQLYTEKLEEDPTASVSETFAAFDQPGTTLANSYDVEVVDDRWFDSAERQQDTLNLQKELTNQSNGGLRKPKGKRVALHDALLLRWVALEREKETAHTYIVTLDNSLRRVAVRENNSFSRTLAISLDALLQWISPLAMREDDEDKVAAVFSEAVRQQLLPQDKVFDLADFIVFANMEMDCRELPAEDVEECIRYLKANAYDLNPGDPTDQQKLAREISKFFADPGRKHSREVQRLEAELSSAQEEKELEDKRKQTEYDRKLQEQTEENERQKQENESRLQERDEHIRRLEEERIERGKRDDRGEQKQSAYRWLVFCVLIFVFLEAVLLYIVGVYGEGPNILQKVQNAWMLVSGTSVAVIVGLLYLMGKDRMRLVDIPLPQLFGNADKEK